METIRQRTNGMAASLAAAFLFLALAVCGPPEVRAQWATNGEHISNTNAGNVGVGTPNPTSLFQVTQGTAGPGTVTTTAGSTAVTGTGTRFLNTFKAGDAITANGETRIITAVASDTSLTTAAWTNSNTGVAYTLAGGARLSVMGNGNVGVGTAAPTQRLHIEGSLGDTVGDIPLKLVRNSQYPNFEVSSMIGKATTTGDMVDGFGLRYLFAIQDNANVENFIGAVGAVRDGADNSGKLIFQTYNAGANSTKMVVDKFGNVGVGTAAPIQRLHVFGGNVFHQFSAAPGQEWGFYGSTRNNHLTSNLYFDGQWKMLTAGKGAFISTAPLDGAAFSVYADNADRAANAPAAFSSLMRVNMNGNVGIGTDVPAHKLDVAGNINSTGLCLAGDCKTAWSQVGGSGASAAANVSAGQFGSATGGGNYSFPANVLMNSGAGSLIDAGASNRFRVCGPSGSCAQAGEYIGGRLRLSANGSFASAEALADPGMGGIHAPGNVYLGGNVGVGTTSPATKLHVVGDVTVTGNISAKYQDVAEWVPSTQRLPAGTVVVLDDARTNHVLAATAAYDTRVAGVVSARPGLLLGEGGEGKVAVATTGRVRVRVDATRGAIKVGDLLVTSEVEGVAMRSVPLDLGGIPLHRPGTIIGKALEPLERGTGGILVLLSLQ